MILYLEDKNVVNKYNDFKIKNKIIKKAKSFKKIKIYINSFIQNNLVKIRIY